MSQRQPSPVAAEAAEAEGEGLPFFDSVTVRVDDDDDGEGGARQQFPWWRKNQRLVIGGLMLLAAAMAAILRSDVSSGRNAGSDSDDSSSSGSKTGSSLWFSGDVRGVGEQGGDATSPRAVDPVRSVVDASAGQLYMLAVLDDHSVISAGYIQDFEYYHDQFGVNRTLLQKGVNEAVAVSEVVVDGETVDAPDFGKVFAGESHSVFIDTSGNAYAAGRNDMGQLCFDVGMGVGVNQDLPRKIVGLLDGEKVVDAAVGQSHTLILTDAGRVYGCGDGLNGQLGLGGADSTSTPQRIGLEGVTAVAAGTVHSLVLNDEGLYAMGYNYYGQLCTGEVIPRFTPKLIFDESDIGSFTAGYGSSYVLLDNGTIVACGRNNYGQLGDGTTDRSTGTLVDLNNITSKVIKVISGAKSDSAFLRTQDGNIYGMGENNYGQLGVGDEAHRNVPTQVQFNGAVPSGGISVSDWNTLFW